MREAGRAAARAKSDIERGTWRDASGGEKRFGVFAERILEIRSAELAVRTVQGYRSLLRKHLMPTFGHMKLNAITVLVVDAWYASAARSMPPVTLKNTYFLLSGLMRQAVRYRLVRENSCQREKAGKDMSRRRPELPIGTQQAIIEAHPAELRPLLWLTFGAHLRLGEVCALRRSDLNLEAGTLLVERHVQEVPGGTVVTKTKTGNRRTVAIPEQVLALLADYLRSKPMLPKAPLFTSPRAKGPIRRRYLYEQWRKACVARGVPEFHFHDIRHTSLTLMAQAGATPRENMQRAGHRTIAAAMRYQHALEERDHSVAARASALMPSVRAVESHAG